MDYNVQQSAAKEEGLKEGKLEGLKEGEIKGKIEIARNLLKRLSDKIINYNSDTIIVLTPHGVNLKGIILYIFQGIVTVH